MLISVFLMLVRERVTRTTRKPWSKKIFRRTRKYQGATIKIWGMWSLSLAQAYTALAYYHANREAIDTDLDQRISRVWPISTRTSPEATKV